jgi:4,5-DOPA dioxygenase extradiol
MERMPVLFVGHGSPMNAIEDNSFTQNWVKIAEKMPRPKGIVMISAHWYTSGSRINDAEQPRMVYDMYGFPDKLYKVVYPAKGSSELAQLTRNLLTKDVKFDNTWGYDHGNWSVLKHMYPLADIPLIQLSIDNTAEAIEHYKMGQELKALRERGYLLIGSGNIVHNLPGVRFDMDGGYDWAYEFDNFIKDKIIQCNHRSVIDFHSAGKAAALAVPTPDHFYPLLYILGVSDQEDIVTIYNDSCIYGTLSMTCYMFS